MLGAFAASGPGLATSALCVGTLVLLGYFLCAATAKWTRVPHAIRISLTVFTAHLIVSCAAYGAFGIFANDGFFYDAEAVALAQRLSGDSTATVIYGNGKGGFEWVLGYLYYWCGHQPLLGVILNSILAAMLVPLIGYVCVNFGWTIAASRAMWLAGFAPPLFLWSTFLLREASINFFIALTFAMASKYLASPRIRWLVIMFIVSLPLIWLRGPLIVVIDVGLLLGIVLVGRLDKGRISAGRAALVVVTAVLIAPLALSVLSRFPKTSLSRINVTRVALAQTASTSFGPVSAPTSSLGSMELAFKELPNAAVGPFPWEYSSGFGGALTAFDGLIWLVFAWFIVRAWRSELLTHAKWLCVVPTVLLMLTIALTSGNFGTLIRLRAMEVPFIVPMVAMGTLTRRYRGMQTHPSGPGRATSSRKVSIE